MISNMQCQYVTQQAIILYNYFLVFEEGSLYVAQLALNS